MTALNIEKISSEKREKRALSIAAMGLVNREGDHFRVSTPSLRGKQTSYQVWRDETGKIRCNCLEFEEKSLETGSFRCEHILAVKHALMTQNTEAVTKQQPMQMEIKTEVVSLNATELRKDLKDKEEKASEVKQTKSSKSSEIQVEMSNRDEQKESGKKPKVEENGQPETEEGDSANLANTIGENQMINENYKELPFITAEEAAELENGNKVVSLAFAGKLRTLRQHVNPELIKQREGWRDSKGNIQMVDYVEWHTVADILDETAPNWTHSVKDIKQIGDIITVTVAITIDGITREGIGTGFAESETGIKKAEHDALKRAAVKFGIARELYKKESDDIEREASFHPNNDGGFPSNPIARSLSDLVTAKQLGMIRAVAREMNVDAEIECQNLMQCRTDELSKRAASALIQHLQTLQQQEAVAPLRKVG